MRYFLSSVILLSGIAACGNDKTSTTASANPADSDSDTGGGTKAYTGDLGTCTISGICSDFSFSGTMSADPTADAKVEATKACADNAGTAGTGTCSITDAVGFCTITKVEKSNAETFTFKMVIVFAAPLTVAQAQHACTAAPGTFSTTYP